MLKRIAKWALLTVLVGAGVAYAAGHPELLGSLRKMPAGALLVLIGISVAGLTCLGVQLKLLCAVFGTDLQANEWFGLAACNAMYNYLAPGRPGIVARALYLKRVHRLSYAHFSAVFAGSNVLALLVAGLIGTGAAGAMALAGAPGRWKLLGVFVVLFSVSVGGACLLALSTKVVEYVPIAALRKVLVRAAEGITLYLKEKEALVKVACCRVLNVALAATGFYVSCRALGLVVTPVQAVAVQCMGTFAILLPLTPAALGIREGVVSYAAHLMGLPPQTAMLAALVQRGASVVVTFSLGLLFSYVLLKDWDSSPLDSPPSAEPERDNAD